MLGDKPGSELIVYFGWHVAPASPLADAGSAWAVHRQGPDGSGRVPGCAWQGLESSIGESTRAIAGMSPGDLHCWLPRAGGTRSSCAQLPASPLARTGTESSSRSAAVPVAHPDPQGLGSLSLAPSRAAPGCFLALRPLFPGGQQGPDGPTKPLHRARDTGPGTWGSITWRGGDVCPLIFQMVTPGGTPSPRSLRR